MSVAQIVTSVALVSPAGTSVATLQPFECAWALDEGASPYVIATLVVAAPTAAQYAMMRPGSGYYLSVSADYVGSASGPGLWKIVSRERTLEGRVRLQAVSAELDLQSYRPAVSDRSNWANQTNVELIVANVLNRVYGVGKWARYKYISDGAFGQDIPLTPYRTYLGLTNLLPNPSVTTVTGYEANSAGGSGSGQVTLSQVTDGGRNGARARAASPNAWIEVRSKADADTGAVVNGGETYTGSVLPRASNRVPLNGALYLQFFNDNGTLLQTNVTTIALFANTYGGNARPQVTGTAPIGSVRARLVLRAFGNIIAADVVDGAEWMLVEGNGIDTDATTPVPFFDGERVDGTNGYNYDWTGAANASPSTRTPVVDRDPDALTWSPGQSAWDFLTPILQASGVRVFSDGYRAGSGAVVPAFFWVLNEFGFAAAPVRVLQTSNLYELTQVDSWTAEFPDGTPMFADQVIIRYTWNDAANVAREAFDVYPSTPGKKPWYIELENTPYAGAGRAQGIYKRITARATILEGTTWFDRFMQPGKQLSVTADVVGGSNVGYIDAVTHDPFRGTTEFRTKQTVAYTSASWLSATGTWASQTGSWAADV